MSERARHVDVHTGAFLRDHFLAELSTAVGRSSRDKAPLCLLLIDVDEVQEANDLHGRESVDAQLSKFASAVAEGVDGLGPIGRIENDTFAILLEGMTLPAAVSLAERVRARLRTQRPPRLLGSIGVAQARPGEPWGNLLDAAEAAVIQAKQS